MRVGSLVEVLLHYKPQPDSQKKQQFTVWRDEKEPVDQSLPVLGYFLSVLGR